MDMSQPRSQEPAQREDGAHVGESILEKIDHLPDRPLSFVDRTYARRFLRAGDVGSDMWVRIALGCYLHGNDKHRSRNG